MKLNLKNKLSFEGKQKISGYLFCLPLIIGILAIFLPNIIKTFFYSINDVKLVGDSLDLSFNGFGYYKEALFENEKFNGYVIKSLGNMLINLPIILIFSLFIATLLNKDFIGRTFVRSVFFLPIILSTGIIVTVQSSNEWNMMATGVYNDALASNSDALKTLLSSLNMGDSFMKVIVNAANSVSTIVTSSGMQILLFLTALQEISPEYYEAANVDGCSNWEMFWKITIPLLVPHIAVNAIYTVADSFVRGETGLFSYINNLAYSGNQFSLAMAMYFIYLIALTIVVLIMAYIVIKMLKMSK